MSEIDWEAKAEELALRIHGLTNELKAASEEIGRLRAGEHPSVKALASGQKYAALFGCGEYDDHRVDLHILCASGPDGALDEALRLVESTNGRYGSESSTEATLFVVSDAQDLGPTLKKRAAEREEREREAKEADKVAKRRAEYEKLKKEFGE